MADIHLAELVLGFLVLCMLALSHGLLGHLDRTEPLLMLLVKTVLFLLRRVTMSAVKKACD